MYPSLAFRSVPVTDDLEQDLIDIQEERVQIYHLQALISTPSCFECDTKSTPSSPLQRCSRCHCAYYCSRDCQLNHYSSHKQFCLEYKTINQKLIKLKKKLLKVPDALGNGKYFEKGTIGHFWTLFDPRDYCRTRWELAEHILLGAHQSDLKPLYEMALSHMLELLRLIHGDNLGLRDVVPFVLITLNRDQDAYDFIKWWLTAHAKGKLRLGAGPKNTKEGDWLWLRNENIYENFLSTDLKINYKNVNLSFLASMFLIKLRLLYAVERGVWIKNQVAGCMENMSSDDRVLKQIGDIVACYLCPSGLEKMYGSDDGRKKVKMFVTNEVVEEQEKYVSDLLKQMVKNNKMFVQSLVNPLPMRQQEYPTFHSPGSPEEAYLVMNNCCRLFARTPEARMRLMCIVGENPQYEPHFRSW